MATHRSSDTRFNGHLHRKIYECRYLCHGVKHIYTSLFKNKKESSSILQVGGYKKKDHDIKVGVQWSKHLRQNVYIDEVHWF